MRSSLLRHSIELQSATENPDTYGQPIKTWSTYATVKAHISPLRGTERMIAGQVQENVTHKIRIWHRDDVTANHRIMFGSRIFAVLTVLDLEEHGVELELLCMEQPNA